MRAWRRPNAFFSVGTMTQQPDSPVVAVQDAVYGYTHGRIVDGLSLTLRRGRITAFLGPSGCGKTTLMRLIAGMENLQGGRITIDAAGSKTPFAYMFQDYDTFPWLTVRQNLALSGEHREDVVIKS